MTKGQLERFAGFTLRKYLPQTATSAQHDITSGQFEKKSKELMETIASAATALDTAERDQIVHNALAKLKQAYLFYSN